MILRDLDFISGAARTSGTILIYRYRTGALRERVRKIIGLAAPTEDQELDVLNERWCFPDLFPNGSVICELSYGKTKGLQILLQSILASENIQPSRPTAIFVPASWRVFSDPNFDRLSHVTVLEEHAIGQANLTDSLAFLLNETDLPASQELLEDKEFLKHFKNLVAEGEITGIDELNRELDRVLLLDLDATTGKYIPELHEERGTEMRSMIVPSIRRLLSQESLGPVDLVEALALKQQRGWSSRELVSELFRATILIGSEKSSASARQADALVVWAVLLFLLSEERKTIDTDDDQNAGCGFLVEVDQMVRNFVRCLAMPGDPLAEHWTRFRHYYCGWFWSETDDAPSQENELWKIVQMQIAAGDPQRWTRFTRLLNLPTSASAEQPAVPEYKEADRSTLPLSALSGVDAAVDAIRQRFDRSLHQVPFLIIGPDGIGKVTLARSYAKPLLCDAAIREIDPCGECLSCRSFDAGSVGYTEFDLAHLRKIDVDREQQLGTEARKQIDALKYMPFARHRVIVIKNSDVDTQSLDVFLKSLEAGAEQTTFILLAQNRKAIRKAALSRCSEISLRPLNDTAARRLITRWVEPYQFDQDVLDVVIAYGEGLPGQLKTAVDALSDSRLRNVGEAKKALCVGWGRDAIDCWRGILSGALRPADIAKCFPGISGFEKIQRLKKTFAIVRTPEIVGSPGGVVFLGLSSELSALRGELSEYAEQCGLSVGELWSSIAGDWNKGSYFDDEGLAELAAATRYKVSEALPVNG